jgi:hypothetical protein
VYFEEFVFSGNTLELDWVLVYDLNVSAISNLFFGLIVLIKTFHFANTKFPLTAGATTYVVL